MFHISIWGAKPTKAPRGDGTVANHTALIISQNKRNPAAYQQFHP